MCRKVPYPTRSGALSIVRSIRRLNLRRVYRCDLCDQWHVTRMSNGTYKRVARGR